MSMKALREALLGKREKTVVGEQRLKLEKLGVIIHNDDKLNDRIEQLEILHRFVSEPIEEGTPLGKIKELQVKLSIIDEFIRKGSVPWCRGGSEAKFAQMLKGWEKLLQLANDAMSNVRGQFLITEGRGKEDADSILRRLNPEINQEEIYQKLERCIDMEVIRYGLWITDISFFGSDVSPSFNLVLPTQPQFGFGMGNPVIPTSTLPANRPFPDAKPRPERLSAELEDEATETNDEQ